MRNLRKMKIVVCFLFGALFFFSCMKEKDMDIEPVHSGYVVLKSGISAFSTDGNALGEAEYVLRRARLYAFDGNKLDNMVYVDNIEAEDTVVRMKVSQSTNKVLYLIVNEPEEIKNILDGVNNPGELADVQYKLADYMAKEAYNSDSILNLDKDSFCLPMFGKDSVDTVVPDSVTEISKSIGVNRAVARVDVYLQQENIDGATVTVDGSTTLSIRNTCDSGYLLPDRIVKLSTNKEDIVTGPKAKEVPVKIGEGHGAARRFFSFYTPEHDVDSLRFDLKGVTIKNGSDTNQKDFEVTLREKNETLVKKIQRNCVYSVYATFASIGDGKIQLQPEITITNWVDAKDTTLRPEPVFVN